MSRGFGVVQRFVLDEIRRLGEQDPDDRGWLSALQIAEKRAGRTPTGAEIESTRRAIRGLADAGLAEAAYVHWEYGLHQPSVYKGGRPGHRHLSIRLPADRRCPEGRGGGTSRRRA